jgi:hypothetical protein
MKKLALLFIVVACVTSVLSCKKDKQQAAVIHVSATKGTTDWATANVTTGYKPLDTKDTLFILAHNGEENIVIALKQKGVGTYQPAEFKAWYYTTIGLDVLIGRYALTSDAGNSVIITDYNETTHSVKGTFNILFKSTYLYGASQSDEVRFTNGKIDATLSDTFMDPFR